MQFAVIASESEAISTLLLMKREIASLSLAMTTTTAKRKESN